jgi:drug/metabolite transporter superfamily protein YnfA
MLLFLLANLTGVIGGAFVLVVLQPPMDFFYLLPGFVMLGMISANLVFALIIELTKEPDAKTMREVAKKPVSFRSRPVSSAVSP